MRSNIVSSQAALHGRFGGVVPEIASRRHLELVGPVVREALGDAGASFADLRAHRGHGRPGADRGAAGGRLGREGIRVRARRSRWSRSTTCTATSPRCSSRGAARAAVSLPARLGRPHAAARRARPRALDGARPQPRRRRRRGVRQGRAPARSRLPGRPGDRAAAAGGDPGAVALPVAMAGPGGPRPLFSGLKTALRTRLRDERHDDRPTWRRRTRRRSSRASSRAVAAVDLSGGAAPRRGRRRGREHAAARDARAGVRAARDRAARAPLAYCGDNAAMIGAAARFRPALGYPALLDVDAYARATLDAA